MDFFFNNIGGAASALSSPTILLIMFAGVTIAIVLGALPGFGSSQSLALLFPLSFVMTVDQSILFFLAVYSAVEYGSSIPAILIRTPGSGGSAIVSCCSARTVRSLADRPTFGCWGASSRAVRRPSTSNRARRPLA